MQSRVALERNAEACKVVHLRSNPNPNPTPSPNPNPNSNQVVHVRCRAHEQAEDGSLARRLCAQLCGYDVFASLKYIIPLLGQAAVGQAAGQAAAGGCSEEQRRDAQLDAEIDAALRLVCAMQGRCGLKAGEAFDFNDLAQAAQQGTHGASEHREGDREGDRDGDRDGDGPGARGGARGGGGGGQRAAAEAEAEEGSGDGSTGSSIDDDRDRQVGTRLALLIDDLHLADQHSCKLLQRLAASSTARPGPLLLIIASRDERASLSKQRSGGDGRSEQRVSNGRRLVHILASQPSSLKVQCLPLSNPTPTPTPTLNLTLASTPTLTPTLAPIPTPTLPQP